MRDQDRQGTWGEAGYVDQYRDVAGAMAGGRMHVGTVDVGRYSRVVVRVRVRDDACLVWRESKRLKGEVRWARREGMFE